MVGMLTILIERGKGEEGERVDVNEGNMER